MCDDGFVSRLHNIRLGAGLASSEQSGSELRDLNLLLCDQCKRPIGPTDSRKRRPGDGDHKAQNRKAKYRERFQSWSSALPKAAIQQAVRSMLGERSKVCGFVGLRHAHRGRLYADLHEQNRNNEDEVTPRARLGEGELFAAAGYAIHGDVFRETSPAISHIMIAGEVRKRTPTLASRPHSEVRHILGARTSCDHRQPRAGAT
ncbi:hypothetical protein [Terrarubrum flagellatum]|uniref:hypothetical protein n=1 Tax=Terrirubrum flagellatum TaxID=2895980 RepID=UPI00314501A5